MHEIYEPHRFYQNKGCKYFPCHELKESDLSKALFNCMFCYCPLYALGKDCGGNYKIIKSKEGKLIKDCSDCVLPHRPEMYEYINQKLSELNLHLEGSSETLPDLQKPVEVNREYQEDRDVIDSINEMICRLDRYYNDLYSLLDEGDQSTFEKNSLKVGIQITESLVGLDRLLLRLIDLLGDYKHIIALVSCVALVEEVKSNFDDFILENEFVEDPDKINELTILDDLDFDSSPIVIDFKLHKQIVPALLDAVLSIANGDVLDKCDEPMLRYTMGVDEFKTIRVSLVTFVIMQDLGDALGVFFDDGPGSDDIPVQKTILASVRNQFIDDMIKLINFFDIASVSPDSQTLSKFVHPQLLTSITNAVKFFTEFCDQFGIPEYCDFMNLESFKFLACDVCGLWEIFFDQDDFLSPSREFHRAAEIIHDIAIDSLALCSFTVAHVANDVISSELDAKIAQAQELVRLIDSFASQAETVFEHSDEPVDPLVVFQLHEVFGRLAKSIGLINLAPNAPTFFGQRLLELLRFKLNEFLTSQNFVDFMELMDIGEEFKLTHVPESVKPVAQDLAALNEVLLECHTTTKLMSQEESQQHEDEFAARAKVFEAQRETFRDCVIRVLLSSAIQGTPDLLELQPSRRKFVSFLVLTEAPTNTRTSAILRDFVDSDEFARITEFLISGSD